MTRAECVLKREVAEALARVQADLATQQLGLKVYDCYRPTRAVAAFARWAKSADDGTTRRFYPKLDKAPAVRARLYRRAFGAFDRHRRRSHADCARRQRNHKARRLRSARALTAPAPGRWRNARRTIRSTWAPASTASTTEAHTASAGLTPEQAHLRALLVAAMRKRGFRNYFREWWHFSFGARPAQAYDFAIAPRP